MPHGMGLMVYDAHRSYQGHWNEHGRWHGKGRMISRIYDYDGEFVEDQKHGYGIWKHKLTGDVYEGEFVRDVKHGKGHLYFGNGNTYFGYFSDNKFNGQGKYEWNDGSMYFGQWKEGMKSGHGILMGADGTTLHDGLFWNDEPVRGYNTKEFASLRSTFAEI